MITLDTSAIFALLYQKDPWHERCKQVLLQQRQPLIIPAVIMSEVAYMIEQRLPLAALEALLIDIDAGDYRLDCGEADLPRIRQFMRRYRDLPLGYADAAVIACAERSGKKVLTLDFRHFSVVEREGTIEVLPQH